MEGGAQCETKQVKLDGGKAKCKLRAAENKPVRNEKKFNLILGRTSNTTLRILSVKGGAGVPPKSVTPFSLKKNPQRGEGGYPPNL